MANQNLEYGIGRNSGCPPNCPQNVVKADATSRTQNMVTPQIADGSKALPQREGGTLTNADSRLQPHEQQLIEGVVVGLQAGYSEAVMAKLASSVWAWRAAKG